LINKSGQKVVKKQKINAKLVAIKEL